jgi:hypothetical protein
VDVLILFLTWFSGLPSTCSNPPFPPLLILVLYCKVLCDKVYLQIKEEKKEKRKDQKN